MTNQNIVLEKNMNFLKTAFSSFSAISLNNSSFRHPFSSKSTFNYSNKTTEIAIS